MLTEIPVEQYNAALDRCAEDVLWEANVDLPPVDAFVVARRLKLRVTSNAGLSERARFVRPSQARANRLRGVIVLGPEGRPERRQWAIAHEIGEAIAYRVFEILEIAPEETPPLEREHVANSLAGRLLAPKRWLSGVAEEVDLDLIAIKEIFATASHELLARRLLECRRSPLMVSVFDNGALTLRRWNLAGKPPPLREPERACRERAHRSARTACHRFCRGEFPEPIARIRCWPIHEPEWRREILFTELEEP